MFNEAFLGLLFFMRLRKVPGLSSVHFLDFNPNCNVNQLFVIETCVKFLSKISKKATFSNDKNHTALSGGRFSLI